MNPKKLARRLEGPRTWGQIKAAIESAGVKDGDPVWAIDLGPYKGRIIVDRDAAGSKSKDAPGVEISDDSSELIDNES